MSLVREWINKLWNKIQHLKEMNKIPHVALWTYLKKKKEY